MATYYVNDLLGDDTWSGTLPFPNDALTDGPWKTPARVTTAGTTPFTFAGDSILFHRDQDFAGHIILFIQGTIGTPLTLGAYGTPSLPLPRITPAGAFPGITVQDCGWVRVENLEIMSSGTSGIFFTNPSGTTYGFDALDCVVHDCLADGIQVGGGITIDGGGGTHLLQRNTVYNCGVDGISTFHSAGPAWEISHNTVHSIGISNNPNLVDLSEGDGITTHNGAQGQSIHHNTIYSCRDGIHTAQTGSLTTDPNLIYRNVIYNCTQTGISIGNVQPGTYHSGVYHVYENLILVDDITNSVAEPGLPLQGGIKVGYEDANAAVSLVMENNAVFNRATINPTASFIIYLQQQESPTHENSALSIRNNISKILGAPAKHWDVNLRGNPTGLFTIETNLYGGEHDEAFALDGLDYSFDEWKVASGWDAPSQVADPQWLDLFPEATELVSDMDLRPTSPAIGAAAVPTINPTTDFLDRARSAPHAIGPFHPPPAGQGGLWRGRDAVRSTGFLLQRVPRSSGRGDRRTLPLTDGGHGVDVEERNPLLYGLGVELQIQLSPFARTWAVYIEQGAERVDITSSFEAVPNIVGRYRLYGALGIAPLSVPSLATQADYTAVQTLTLVIETQNITLVNEERYELVITDDAPVTHCPTSEECDFALWDCLNKSGIRIFDDLIRNEPNNSRVSFVLGTMDNLIAAAGSCLTTGLAGFDADFTTALIFGWGIDGECGFGSLASDPRCATAPCCCVLGVNQSTISVINVTDGGAAVNPGDTVDDNDVLEITVCIPTYGDGCGQFENVVIELPGVNSSSGHFWFLGPDIVGGITPAVTIGGNPVSLPSPALAYPYGDSQNGALLYVPNVTCGSTLCVTFRMEAINATGTYDGGQLPHTIGDIVFSGSSSVCTESTSVLPVPFSIGVLGSAGNEYDNQNSVEISIADDGHIDLSTVITALQDPQDRTISVWAKVTGTAADSAILSKSDNQAATTDSTFDLWLTGSGTVSFTGFWGTSSYTLTSSTAIDDGDWHNIVIVLDGPLVKMYIDGVLETQTDLITLPLNGAVSPSTQAIMRVGAFGNTSAGTVTGKFPGRIDEVAIWTTPLGDAPIASAYNGGIAPDLQASFGDYSEAADLAHWWRMGDGSNDSTTLVEDQSGTDDGVPTAFTSPFAYVMDAPN